MARSADRQATAAFLAAFIDELRLLGVQQVVTSPGSRSTPLSLAFFASPMEVTVDIDERGAAFFALGCAKASRRPVCLVCTSGTAAANYLPAICEAQESRVPLIVLSADRPHELRDLGAPQTMDQIKLYGDKVNFFKEMPVACGADGEVAFARQTAKEAFVRCGGAGAQKGSADAAGPVHMNFPFPEPLLIDLPDETVFAAGRMTEDVPALSGVVPGPRQIDAADASKLAVLIASHRSIVVCGEGIYPQTIVTLCRNLGIPLLADPLACLIDDAGGVRCLRSCDDSVVISAYDKIFRDGKQPAYDLVCRFGRYPISKALFKDIEKRRPIQVVVDPVSTRDFDADTSVFVQAEPAAFIDALVSSPVSSSVSSPVSSPEPSRELSRNTPEARAAWIDEWATLETRAAGLLGGVMSDSGTFMGPYIRQIVQKLPEGSLLFSANSLSIRAVDTFLVRPVPPLSVMCNRGLSGIDGTLSSALGASRHFETSVLVTGDLAFLHDVNALALASRLDSHLVVVVFDNGGGGIFQMLPQRSDEDWFSELFLTPQRVAYDKVCEGFGIPFSQVDDVLQFTSALEKSLREVRVSVIGVHVPIDQTAAFGRWW